jgi:hypothetical protein
MQGTTASRTQARAMFSQQALGATVQFDIDSTVRALFVVILPPSLDFFVVHR